MDFALPGQVHAYLLLTSDTQWICTSPNLPLGGANRVAVPYSFQTLCMTPASVRAPKRIPNSENEWQSPSDPLVGSERLQKLSAAEAPTALSGGFSHGTWLPGLETLSWSALT